MANLAILGQFGPFILIISFLAILGHFGPFGSFGPFYFYHYLGHFIFSHFGSFWAILDQFGAFLVQLAEKAIKANTIKLSFTASKMVQLLTQFTYISSGKSVPACFLLRIQFKA